MLTVVVKYNGEFLDELTVETDDIEEAVEVAKDKIREKLRVSSVVINLEYDGETLDVPEVIDIDEDELLDRIIEDNFEFEVVEE